MTDEAMQTPERDASEPAPYNISVSEAAFLESQKHAIEAHERIEIARINARADADAEQRRIVAMNCALASLGVGHACLQPPSSPPGIDDVIVRAARIDAFIRGEANANVAPIRAVPAGE